MKTVYKIGRWVLVGLVIGVVAIYLWLFRDLPAPDDLRAYTSAPSSKIYDRYGRLLFEMPPPYTGSHTPVILADIPDAMRWATIATEDATFYDNPGMDARAILRSIWINIQGGEVLAGGSTITQQLARNVLLDPEERAERTLRRKLREMVLAVHITRAYTKDEILLLYLNEIYYGNLAYGVEAAAQAYYNKHIHELDLAECAMLAGLPQLPAIYNPLENLDAAQKRQAVVLDLMTKQGYITPEDAQLAKVEKLSFAATPFPIHAPHFVMYVRGFLERMLGLERLMAGGLNIYTTLDLDLNETARDIMRQNLARLEVCNYETQCPPGGHNVRNAAILALDPRTGEVLAMVGSPDYFATDNDGAVNGTVALRQPGSSIKPLVYVAAFEAGLTPATMLVDERTAFVTREGVPYVPLNYDLQFRGPVQLREALASSYNVIAVKVLDTIGVEALPKMARRLGMTTFDDPDRIGLAIALGGGEVQLLELTAAYAAFANQGRRVSPVVVQRVETTEGIVLWSAEPGIGTAVLDARVAYLITDILSDDLARIPTFGEGSVLNLRDRPAAVKTGTTTDFRDNWTVGYTPALVVGVWVGNADNEAMHNVSGITGAGPIWHDVMEAALKGTPVEPFSRPEGLIEVEVCASSGLLPGPDCQHTVTELFIAGTEPTSYELRATNPESRTQNLQTSAPLLPTSSAPRLRLTRPDEGALFRIDPALSRSVQKIEVMAEGEAVTQVSLLIDKGILAWCPSLPCSSLWQLKPGTHSFSAMGIDTHGMEVKSNSVTIAVQE